MTCAEKINSYFVFRIRAYLY